MLPAYSFSVRLHYSKCQTLVSVVVTAFLCQHIVIFCHCCVFLFFSPNIDVYLSCELNWFHTLYSSRNIMIQIIQNLYYHKNCNIIKNNFRERYIYIYIYIYIYQHLITNLDRYHTTVHSLQRLLLRSVVLCGTSERSFTLNRTKLLSRVYLTYRFQQIYNIVILSTVAFPLYFLHRKGSRTYRCLSLFLSSLFTLSLYSYFFLLTLSVPQFILGFVLGEYLF